MNRTLGLAVGLFAAFVIIVLILLQIMPGPLGSTDYLVIGAAATLSCLLLLFWISKRTLPKPPPPANRD